MAAWLMRIVGRDGTGVWGRFGDWGWRERVDCRTGVSGSMWKCGDWDGRMQRGHLENGDGQV